MHLEGMRLGGGERVASRIAADLHGRGFVVGVVTDSPGPAMDWFADAEPSYHFLAATTARNPYATWKLSRIATGYDLLYSHIGCNAQIVDGLACLLAGRPHVVHQHTNLEFSTRPLTGPMQRWLYARVVSRATVISVATHVRDQTIKAGVPETRARVVPNGVPLQPGPESPSSPSARPRVGMLTRLEPVKGLELFLEAAQRLAGVEFVIGAAPGPDAAYDTRVRDQARRGGVPVLAVDSPAEFMSSLDIFCLPSRQEGMSLVLLEAMALGKPLVVSDIPGTREVVDEDSAVIVPYGDAIGLADAVRDLITSEERRRTLGRNAAARVRTEHSLEGMTRSVADILERRLAGARARAHEAP